MNSVRLNLARAWRPKTFGDVVGQDLAVRLIKNSLYKQQFFPAYLLAGQRGCGKTTLGRIFAAAINCAQKEAFAKQPHEVQLPCLTCPSCVALYQGSHPDFYEIDAASHTGVDNIRSLIETATLLPGLGTRKIYLIDEAHMLSKAAFNAFLKVLEEPPSSVVFMLATTDPHKVIDTVRSRCFQLFLEPLDPYLMQNYLVSLCKQEQIAYEESALLLIAQESEGSMRDALNCIERVRLAYEEVTTHGVLTVLGDVSWDTLLVLCEAAFLRSPGQIVDLFEKLAIKRYAASRLWKKMNEVLRVLLSIKVHIVPAHVRAYEQQLKKIAAAVSLDHLVRTLELWYVNEPLLIKTQAPDVLIEMLLLRMNPQGLKQGNDSTPTRLQEADAPKVEPTGSSITHQAKAIAHHPLWNEFVHHLAAKDDPLTLSIFKQGRYAFHDTGSVTIVFGHHLAFFKELLEQTRVVWQPLVEQVFGAGATLISEFTDQQAPLEPLPAAEPIKPQQVPVKTQTTKTTAQPAAIKVDNKERWKKVHMVLQVFPGTVSEDRG